MENEFKPGDKVIIRPTCRYEKQYGGYTYIISELDTRYHYSKHKRYLIYNEDRPDNDLSLLLSIADLYLIHEPSVKNIIENLNDLEILLETK